MAYCMNMNHFNGRFVHRFSFNYTVYCYSESALEKVKTCQKCLK